MPGELKIAEHGFPVCKAVLRANLFPDEFNWSLKIYTEERRLGVELVSPFAYAESITALRNRSVSRWTDLIGQKVSWEDCYDDERGGWQAGICLWSHEAVDEATLEFCRDDDGLFVKWKGLVETDLDGMCNDDHVPFSVETPVTFEGYEIWQTPKAQTLDELRKWVTGERFKEPELQSNGNLLFGVEG